MFDLVNWDYTLDPTKWWWCKASCPQMFSDILGTNCDQCLSTVQCCFTSTETVRFIRTESPGQPPRLSHSSWTQPTTTTKAAYFSLPHRCHYLTNGDVTAFALSSPLCQGNNNATNTAVSLLLVFAIQQQHFPIIVFLSVSTQASGIACCMTSVWWHARSCIHTTWIKSG